MVQRKHNKKHSPRKSFGGNAAGQNRKTAQQDPKAKVNSPKPRAWWHWTLVGIVSVGILGFVLQMRLSDPAQLSLERLQFLIAYAGVLFICSIALGILEWTRYRVK